MIIEASNLSPRCGLVVLTHADEVEKDHHLGGFFTASNVDYGGASPTPAVHQDNQVVAQGVDMLRKQTEPFGDDF